jgi:hypothetical protein
MVLLVRDIYFRGHCIELGQAADRDRSLGLYLIRLRGLIIKEEGKEGGEIGGRRGIYSCET